MADMFSDGLVSLAADRNAYLSVAVTYRRGALSVPILAMPSVTQREVVGDDHVTRIWEGRDFVLSYLGLDPAEGDVITDAGVEYVVCNPPTGEAAWRFCDPAKLSVRVHTKRR